MSKKSKEPTFEEALEKLEGLIDAMESGEIPLAELVDKFEEGTILLKTCQAKLDEAELKIEQLNLKNGSIEPSPLDTEE